MAVLKRQVDAFFDGGAELRAGEIARRLGVSRQTAHRYLRELVTEGRLLLLGGGRSTRYRRRPEVGEHRYPIAGLEEDRAWREMSGPGSAADALPEPARGTLQYIFTEIVNNAIDHSGADEVEIRLTRDGDTVTVEIRDRGVGIFRHVMARLGLGSPLEAIEELAKGKTTTKPDRHTGEGIFFSSKAAQRFEIRSGVHSFVVDQRRDDFAVGTIDPPVEGTWVRAEIDVSRARDLTAVFAEYTRDYKFVRTRCVVRLYEIGTSFISRSEAKRLVRGLERFREVVLDFRGVRLVGQGFADEVFRVWASDHPEVELLPVDMDEAVAFMVERAIRARRGSREGE